MASMREADVTLQAAEPSRVNNGQSTLGANNNNTAYAVAA